MARTARVERCEARGQGHLNYLFYTHRLGPGAVKAIVEPRGHGVVNTVGYITKDRTSRAIEQFLTPDGLVANEGGSPSAVVHRYDRHAALKQLVARLGL